MKASELLRKLKSYAHRNGLVFELEKERSKGSHSIVHVGERFTTIKHSGKELGEGLLKAMLKQLGIDPRDVL